MDDITLKKTQIKNDMQISSYFPFATTLCACFLRLILTRTYSKPMNIRLQFKMSVQLIGRFCNAAGTQISTHYLIYGGPLKCVCVCVHFTPIIFDT